MSVLCSPETSCYWQELQSVCKSRPTSTHMHTLNSLSMSACLFCSVAFTLMHARTHTQIYMHQGHMMRDHHILYGTVEGSRWAALCVKSRCLRCYTPRSSGVCRPKTSAVVECVSKCRTAEYAHTHMGHPGTWHPRHCCKRLCKPIRITKLLIPAILYLTDSRGSRVKAALVNTMTGKGEKHGS